MVAGLEWSGLWWMDARCDGECLRLSCRIPVNGIVLGPGERFDLPAAHYVFSSEGLDGATNACRRYIGDCVVPAVDGEKLVAAFDYNHWFGIGPDINEHLLRRQADRAADLGVEHFIIDAGWYGGCVEGDFETGVGNWSMVDRTKFPHGLKLGLWFEVERAHRQSVWVREHPEWFFEPAAHRRSCSHRHRRSAEAGRSAAPPVRTIVPYALGRRNDSDTRCDFRAGCQESSPPPFPNDPAGAGDASRACAASTAPSVKQSAACAPSPPLRGPWHPVCSPV